MKQHRTKITLAVLALVVMISGAVLVNLLNSPKWWAGVVKAVINKQPKEQVYCRDLTIDKVGINWREGVVSFQGIKIKLKLNGQVYFISLDEVKVSELYEIFKRQASIGYDISHVAIVSDLVNVSELKLKGNLELLSNKVSKYNGLINALSLDLNRIQLTNISTSLSGDLTKARFSQMSFNCYKGQVNADMQIGFSHEMTIGTNAQLKNIDVEALTYLNPEFFSQIQGLVDGRIQVTIQDTKITAFRGMLFAPKGGVIKASLLKELAQYMPQRRMIEELIAQNKKVPVNQAQVETVSLNDEKFSSQIKLFSSELNLDMNITADINVEGGLKAVLGSLGLWGGK